MAFSQMDQFPETYLTDVPLTTQRAGFRRKRTAPPPDACTGKRARVTLGRFLCRVEKMRYRSRVENQNDRN
jgi:hypothetical protein